MLTIWILDPHGATTLRTMVAGRARLLRTYGVTLVLYRAEANKAKVALCRTLGVYACLWY